MYADKPAVLVQTVLPLFNCSCLCLECSEVFMQDSLLILYTLSVDLSWEVQIRDTHHEVEKQLEITRAGTSRLQQMHPEQF